MIVFLYVEMCKKSRLAISETLWDFFRKLLSHQTTTSHLWYSVFSSFVSISPSQCRSLFSSDSRTVNSIWNDKVVTHLGFHCLLFREHFCLITDVARGLISTFTLCQAQTSLIKPDNETVLKFILEVNLNQKLKFNWKVFINRIIY